jgi:predicted RNase H-like HicB family nuclease
MIGINLQLYIFRENGVHIIYCPALDLSAAGKTEAEVKTEFAEVLRLHIEYCVNRNTFVDDLLKHGWVLTKTKAIAPGVERMLNENNMLKDIILNKDYRKITHPVKIPVSA